MDPLVLQVGIAGPLVLGLALHAASRRGQGPVHGTLFWLLAMILAWMVAMMLHASASETAREWGASMLIPPAIAMAPLFFLLMANYARIQLFEQNPGVTWACLAPFGVFFVGFATNDLHGLMMRPGASMLEIDLASDAGPLFWAFQVWSNAAAVAGLAICARIALRSRSRDERRRMLLVMGGAFLPMLVHAAFLLRLLPLSYPLTPASLGITALLVTAAIQRYRLLELQPVARRDVIEASSDGVLVADSDELVVDLNPAAAGILEATHDDLIGVELAEAVGRLGPFQPEDAVERMLRVLRGDGQQFRLEVETERGRNIELSAGTASDASGVRAGHFAVLRDRTGERQAERMLHQGQRLESVGVLAAGVAHEVNNPLAFVRANLVHLQQQAALVKSELGVLPPRVVEELADMPDVITESLAGLDRIHRIVQGLLRFSRMPAGRTPDCNVNDALEEAARFASLDRSDGVRLESRLSASLPAVEASRDQLVQVFLNLFLNAKRALKGRGDGRIVARTRATRAEVVVHIEDNGPGVPEELRARIFDPFFTTRAPNEGTGLGLSIAYDIVRDHEGSIELESPEGGGARFVIRLPRTL